MQEPAPTLPRTQACQTTRRGRARRHDKVQSAICVPVAGEAGRGEVEEAQAQTSAVYHGMALTPRHGRRRESGRPPEDEAGRPPRPPAQSPRKGQHTWAPAYRDRQGLGTACVDEAYGAVPSPRRQTPGHGAWRRRSVERTPTPGGGKRAPRPRTHPGWTTCCRRPLCAPPLEHMATGRAEDGRRPPETE